MQHLYLTKRPPRFYQLTKLYGNVIDALPPDTLPPHGRGVNTICYMDADLAGNNQELDSLYFKTKYMFTGS